MRHCRSGALTASMDAVDFHQSIMKGECVYQLGLFGRTRKAKKETTLNSISKNLLLFSKDKF